MASENLESHAVWPNDSQTFGVSLCIMLIYVIVGLCHRAQICSTQTTELMLSLNWDIPPKTIFQTDIFFVIFKPPDTDVL